MPDQTIGITISEPVSATIRSVSDVVVSILKVAETTRAGMSEAAKDEQDHINAQMYWDWRAFLKFVGIVGEPMPWPPKG